MWFNKDGFIDLVGVGVGWIFSFELLSMDFMVIIGLLWFIKVLFECE